MSNRKEILLSLKQALKTAGFTYANIAKSLGLSEISIKRSFSENNFKLDRLEAICELIGMDLSDLTRLADDSRQKISSLSLAQETELVSDRKFLLVAICVQNAWQLDEIIQYYDIEVAECIRYLIRLEGHGLIHLLTNNRIRRMLAHDFRWLRQGPIETFFENIVQSEFMNSHFSKEGELRIYLMGTLSKNSSNTIKDKLEMLSHEFSSLQQDDAKLPVQERQNMGVMLAIRRWDLSVFASYRRA